MKSRSQSPKATPSATSAVQAAQDTDMGNAAAQEAMDLASGSASPILDSLDVPDLPDSPASAAASALGLDGLQVTDDSVSFKGSGLSMNERVDATLGVIGPLTIGLGGTLATQFDYSFSGGVEGGWFGGRYATISGDASMNLDTSIQAVVALNLLVAEGGLRGGLTMAGGLKGTSSGTLSFDEDGVHIDEITLHFEGQAELGAAAELYLETLLTDEQTWELGSMPLGVASGFALDLSFDDSGLTSFGGSLGSGFTMSPELQETIDGLKAMVTG